MNINHKFIALILGVLITGLIYFHLQNIISIENDITSSKNDNNNISIMNSKLSSELNNVTGKLPLNTDLSFYAANIYAYCLLENIEIEIKNGQSKYQNTIQMHLNYNDFQDKEKFKEFINAMHLLGYVENITKQSLVLNVAKFTKEDENKLITNKEVK